MSLILILLIALGAIAVTVGIITALVIYLMKRNPGTADSGQRLADRVKTLELEVAALKSKADANHD